MQKRRLGLWRHKEKIRRNIREIHTEKYRLKTVELELNWVGTEAAMTYKINERNDEDDDVTLMLMMTWWRSRKVNKKIIRRWKQHQHWITTANDGGGGVYVTSEGLWRHKEADHERKCIFWRHQLSFACWSCLKKWNVRKQNTAGSAKQEVTTAAAATAATVEYKDGKRNNYEKNT